MAVHRWLTVYNFINHLLCGLLPPLKEEETDVSPSLFRNYAFDEYDVQSGTERFGVTINDPSKEVKVTTATFSDQNAAYEYKVNSMPDPTFGQADMGDASLEEFFRRPIKIASYEWGTGNILFESFNPWKLFFENPRVINRVANFALLRAKMHVKIIINGNGFHYGRAIASYNPLDSLDQFTVDRGFFSQDIVAASQRPHIYLDPTLSQGGELCLPFFWYKNALSIPEAEWDEMGTMIIQSLNPLKHANGATDRVTLSVFAWAEDVSLSIPTSVNPGEISPQSGVEKVVGSTSDEYGSGPISRPAGIVARIAGKLKDAPIIGMYARATELAASATANIAALFGYSRPAILNDIVPYKPTFFGNLANTNMPDSVQKLSMDSKQEVTIDPRTVGLADADEMAIVPLAMRESYVTTFPWAIDRTTESLLWNTEVTPMMWAENPITTPSEIHMTPSCWTTLPFKYWRGSMKFRFQVVSSNYHKGRLKIVYDPYAAGTNEYNTNYTYIIDIAEQKDFTVRVGWGNPLGYCTHDTPGLSSPPYSNTPIATIPGATANGILKVYVVNELTVPNSSVDNDITVNVFTSMCDDYDVGNPNTAQLEDYAYAPYPDTVEAQGEWRLGLDDLHRRQQELLEDEKEELRSKAKARIEKYVAQNELPVRLPDIRREDITPQSGVETTQADVENTTDPSAPMASDDPTQLATNTLDPTDAAALVYLGEHITSFRQALKRYTYHNTFGQTALDDRFLKRRYNNMPPYRGFDSNGMHSAESPADLGIYPYNRVKNTLMNWVLPAYVGYRGAVRWKYIVRYMKDLNVTGFPDHTAQMISLKRIATERGGYEISSPAADFTSSDQNQLVKDMMDNTENNWDGSTVSYLQGNSALEAEFPWYSNLRFFPAKRRNRTTDTGFNYFHMFETCTDRTSNGAFIVDAYNSIGEDFNLFFFTGAPIVYYYGRSDPGT